MQNIEYGATVKGNLLSLVHGIIATELPASVKMGDRELSWLADPEIFGAKLKIRRARLKHSPSNMFFMVSTAVVAVDDMEGAVKNGDPDELYEDDFFKDIQLRIGEIVLSHPHEKCLELRQHDILERERDYRSCGHTTQTPLSWK